MHPRLWNKQASYVSYKRPSAGRDRTVWLDSWAHERRGPNPLVIIAARTINFWNKPVYFGSPALTSWAAL